jgi:formylglycine-generating enzyme required for sulfatase activity
VRARPLLVATLMLAFAAGPGCTLCWPRGGALQQCGDDDDATTADDDDATTADDDDATGPDADGMLPVPAGSVTMGCDPATATTCESDEMPLHTVTVAAFRMHELEVTNGAFVAFLNDHGNDCGGFRCLGVFAGPEVTEADGVWSVLPDAEDRPAVEVTWYGADEYCAEAGLRLPTEAEWERAARGDDGRTWPWGEAELDCGRAIYGDGCGTGSAWDVGEPRSAGRSPFGMYDMSGNAWEWVSDWYGDDYYAESPDADPQGPVFGSSKVARGGGWESSPTALEPWSRWARDLEFGASAVGFRCAGDPQ